MDERDGSSVVLQDRGRPRAPLPRPGAADSRPSSSSRTSFRRTTSSPASPPTSRPCAASARRAAACSPRIATGASSSSRAIPSTPSNTRRALHRGPRGRCRASTTPIASAARSSGGKPVAWDDAEKQLARQAGRAREGQAGRAHRGGERASRPAASPASWTSGCECLGARTRVAYEPLGYESLRAANRIAFGRDAIPDYAIGEAGYLVSFGADFLETWLNSERAHRRLRPDARLRPGKAGHVRARRAAACR